MHDDNENYDEKKQEGMTSKNENIRTNTTMGKQQQHTGPPYVIVSSATTSQHRKIRLWLSELRPISESLWSALIWAKFAIIPGSGNLDNNMRNNPFQEITDSKPRQS